MHKNKCCNGHPEIGDHGPNPIVINIDHATKANHNFRTTVWTGENLQLTLMSIPPHSDIGPEIHHDVDQFIRIECGLAKVYTGSCKGNLTEQQTINENFAFIIPAGTWHNIVNVGKTPLKLYSLYAPPKHPFGTVHRTKAEAEMSE